MVFKEKKLAILIYLLRYGRMTSEECSICIGLSGRSACREWNKLCSIPGIYKNRDSSILMSFYYIISHRIPEFYDCNDNKILLKNIINKSPLSVRINPSSIETLTQAFA